MDDAYRAALDEAAALRLANAERLQEALHERVAAAWSAANWALTLTHLGRYDAAEAALGEQLARTEARSPDAGFLLARRALVRLGRGRRRPALDDLGRAVLLGDPDAAVVLARDHLLHGRPAAARAGFRSLLLQEPPGAWALRGWGLTLIDDLGSPAPGGGSAPADRPARNEDR